jgi:hypothetical protein
MGLGREVRATLIGLSYTVIDAARKLLSERSLSLDETIFTFLGSLVLGYYLVWLQDRASLRRSGLTILLWMNLFVVGSFSNMLEGYFFTNVFDSFSTFAMGAAVMLASTGIQAAALGYLLRPGERSLRACFDEYMGKRSGGDWLKRLAAGTLTYFPVYFFFGMLISPFVMPYYSDPSLGLVIPSFSVIIPLEILRGLMYVAVLLPIVACLEGEARSSSLALACMLFIPGALLPLLGDQGLPAPIIPFHLAEILADSAVYGYLLAHLLGFRKTG